MNQRKRRSDDEALLAKIRALLPERVAEVEDFVDFPSATKRSPPWSRAARRITASGPIS